MAYYSIEPWGEYRADVRSALLCQLTYNAHRGKGSRNLTLHDFMPFVKKEPEQLSQAEQVKRTREKIQMLSKLSKKTKRRKPDANR